MSRTASFCGNISFANVVASSVRPSCWCVFAVSLLVISGQKSAAQGPSTVDAAAFAVLDVNEDGVLSGQEAKSVLTFDADGDGEVSLAEFVAGRKRGKGKPGKDDAAVTPPVVAIDPRQQEWNDQLAKQLQQGQRWAILIGVNKYPTNPLRFCVPDARLLADTLVNQCGYPRDHVVLMTDDQEDERLHPRKLHIQAVIPALLRRVGPKDTVLVFYTGHGLALEGQSYLCPIDFDGAAAKLTGWRMDELRSMLQDSAAGQKLLVLDTCHSGGAVTTSGFGATPQELGGAFELAQGTITFASCRTNQESVESAALGHGVFTHALTCGLAGQADFDRNGIVDSDELYRHLMLTVPAAAQAVVKNHKQHPVRLISQDVVGVFALSRPDGKPVPTNDPTAVPSQPGDLLMNSIGMKLTPIPIGLFVMGSPASEYLRDRREMMAPVLRTRPVLMGAYEVTQSQYQRVMRSNPSWFSVTGGGAGEVAGMNTEDFPVEQVSWQEAMQFCQALSALPEEVARGLKYRLPTEAEWEFACRAGTTTPFNTGVMISPKLANLRGDRPYFNSPKGPSLGRTTTVGSYPANLLGLYDMHGNVGEWCSDRLTWTSLKTKYWIDNTRIPNPKTPEDVIKLMEDLMAVESSNKGVEIPIDPVGITRGDPRVYRGGAFSGDVSFARSAARREQDGDYRNKSIGFRVVAEPIK